MVPRNQRFEVDLGVAIARATLTATARNRYEVGEQVRLGNVDTIKPTRRRPAAEISGLPRAEIWDSRRISVCTLAPT